MGSILDDWKFLIIQIALELNMPDILSSYQTTERTLTGRTGVKKTLVGRNEWENFKENPTNDVLRLFISGDRNITTLEEFLPFANQFESINFFATTLSSLRGIDRFKNLKSLNVSRTRVTDNDMPYLSDMNQLIRLELNGNTISNIDSLNRLTNLDKLGLACTSVSDLSALSNMKRLKVLDLYQTLVHDKSLESLQNLNVKDLDIRLTKASPML